MPRVIAHPMLDDRDVTYWAQFAPRAQCVEALEAFRAGMVPPTYRQTDSGLVRVSEPQPWGHDSA